MKDAGSCTLGNNTYFGLGADWLRFDLVIFAFGNSQELLEVSLV